MVMADEVLFEIVSESVLVLPITTWPKFSVAFPTPTVPVPFWPPSRPWHPVSVSVLPVMISAQAKSRNNR